MNKTQSLKKKKACVFVYTGLSVGGKKTKNVHVYVCVCVQDTIRGMMGWKKFPSQGLTSLANIPTLTNVWVPRWSVPHSHLYYPSLKTGPDHLGQARGRQQ